MELVFVSVRCSYCTAMVIGWTELVLLYIVQFMGHLRGPVVAACGRDEVFSCEVHYVFYDSALRQSCA